MVIFSTGAVVLFDWINQTASRLGRLSQEQQRLFGELVGIEYARSLNPMLRPSGEIVIDDIKIRWQSTPFGEEAPARSGGGNGIYRVQLYKVQLTTQARKSPPSAQDLQLAGWRELQDAGRSSTVDRLFGGRPPDANATP